MGFKPSRADYDTIGEATLSTAQIPSHVLDANFKIVDGGATIPFVAARNGAQGATGSDITTKATGGGQAPENRMPFTTLLTRVWVGY